MILYNTYDFQEIENNLIKNKKLAAAIYNDFKEKADHGNLKDKAFLYILAENVKQADTALINFLKLPLY